MKLMKIALVAGVLTLSVTGLALATGKPETIPPTNTPTPTSGGPNYAPEPVPGPKEGLPEQAKAWGRICKEQNASKKHNEGEKGTAFSRCVTELAKAAHHPNLSARQVCNSASKKHVKNIRGTDFSRCLKAVAALRRQERQSS